MNEKIKTTAVLLLSALCIGSAAACDGDPAPAPTAVSNITNLTETTSSSPFVTDLSSTPNTDSITESSLFSYSSEESGQESSQENSIESSLESSEAVKQEIDPFEGVEITCTGTSPFVTASLNTSKCSDIVNMNVQFSIANDALFRNGDEIKVNAVLSGNTEKYMLSQTEKTFKIENQTEYVTSLEGLDLSELQRELDDKLAVVTAANVGDERFAGIKLPHSIGFSGYFDKNESKSLKSQYLVVRKRQYENNEKIYNRYLKIYDFVVKSRDRDSNDDKDKKITHYYVLVYADSITKDSTGKVAWKLELGWTANLNYDSLINDNITKLRDKYNITEIKEADLKPKEEKQNQQSSR